MIGYYVHHRGLGHLHRARAIAAELGSPMTILSSLPRPSDWMGGWVDLPLDTDRPPVDADAGGTLHWAPLDSRGLLSRMTAISRWCELMHPSVVVVDVSVEVSLLVRLHGIRTVTFAQPGERSDAAHSLGYRLSSAVMAPWPANFEPSSMHPSSIHTLERVGAISRFSPIPDDPTPAATHVGHRTPRNRHQIAVLTGSGGRGPSSLDAVVADAQNNAGDRDWVILRDSGSDVVAETLRESSVVFTHCGQNAIAEVAAFRIPAVLVAEERPHDEQFALARALGGAGLPAVVVTPGMPVDWPETLRTLARTGGAGWSRWSDGLAASRAAAVILRVAEDGVAA